MTNIIYVILFLNAFLALLSVMCLTKIVFGQNSAKDIENSSTQCLIDIIKDSREQTRKSLVLIHKELVSMRKEWDMEALKTNILQRGHGNSANWEKWQRAFGGKKEVKRDDD